MKWCHFQTAAPPHRRVLCLPPVPDPLLLHSQSDSASSAVTGTAPLRRVAPNACDGFQSAFLIVSAREQGRCVVITGVFAFTSARLPRFSDLAYRPNLKNRGKRARRCEENYEKARPAPSKLQKRALKVGGSAANFSCRFRVLQGWNRLSHCFSSRFSHASH